MDILFDVMRGMKGDLGMITLNRPAALNSLNPSMIANLHQQLASWQQDANIKAVIIQKASGRAFCAGGDLRQAYAGAKAKDPRLLNFFRDEYELNKFIYHFKKPYIALLDGITMGGGAGISIHGSHRVATENLLFAMPETGIGFFPDVGGTYFLPRFPGKIGYYLALTSSRVNCDDSVAIGVAQFKLASADLATLVQAIADADWSHTANAKQAVTEIINQFQQPHTESALLQQRDAIDYYFGKETVEEILALLASSPESFWQETATILKTKSPTSLKVTLEALHKGSKLDFDAAMQAEYYLARQFIQSHDFAEGIRAVLIDKDQKPLWQPNSLQQVSKDMIAPYFDNITY